MEPETRAGEYHCAGYLGYKILVSHSFCLLGIQNLGGLRKQIIMLYSTGQDVYLASEYRYYRVWKKGDANILPGEEGN